MTQFNREKYYFAFSVAPLRFLRRSMLAWLQGVYKSMPIAQGCYHFAGNDDPTTEIHIRAQAPWVPTDGDSRPAIVMLRQPMGWNNPGMGGGAMALETMLSNGDKKKTALLSGMYVFNCISKVGDEAEHLAWTTSFWLMECMEMLTKLGFHNLSMPTVGSITPAPDALVQTKSPEWVICPVSIPLTFQYIWRSTMKDQTPLQGIEVNIKDELDTLLQTILVEKES